MGDEVEVVAIEVVIAVEAGPGHGESLLMEKGLELVGGDAAVVVEVGLAGEAVEEKRGGLRGPGGG